MSWITNIIHFFTDAPERLPGADQIAQSTGIQALDDIISKWNDLKDEVDKLFEPEETPASDRSRVVTLYEAKNLLEDFRIKNLKDSVLEKYDRIKAVFFAIKNPPASAAAQAAANDPEVRAGALIALKVEGVLQQIEFFLQQVAEFEDIVIEVVKLFDFVRTEKDKMDDLALQQGNPEIRLDTGGKQRQGKLHGKTRSQEKK